jgi:hypothetical protein
MEPKKNFIEPLIDKTEAYAKSSFELLRLKALDKTGEVTATLISRSLLVIGISFFVFTLNIAIALWLGDLLGKSWYGFMIVASFYALVSIILLMIHPFIKSKANNAIIKKLFN